MKRLVLFFVAVWLANMVMGQHMKFKGVEIDGSISECVGKLELRGFDFVGVDDDVAIMTGNFAGYRDCQIAVMAEGNADVVNAIAVMFPMREEWSSLEYDYDKLKAMLMEKYGLPSAVYEEFQGCADNNFMKLHYLTSDQGVWASAFETENGLIELYMQMVDYGEAMVIMKYYDAINTDLFRSSAMDDI